MRRRSPVYLQRRGDPALAIGTYYGLLRKIYTRNLWISWIIIEDS